MDVCEEVHNEGASMCIHNVPTCCTIMSFGAGANNVSTCKRLLMP